MRPKRFVTLSRFPIAVRCLFLAFAFVGVQGAVSMLFGLGHPIIGDNGGPSRPATPVDAWMPGIFAMIGLGLSLIRYGIVIDVSRRMLVTVAGWALWVKRTEMSLASATSIDVGPVEERGSGSGRYTAIPVKAISPTESKELADPRSYAEARAIARRIAISLNLSIGPTLLSAGCRNGEDPGRGIGMNACCWSYVLIRTR